MANHTIEAQRLLNKLAVTSRRVHGSSHEQTKKAEAMWKRSKLRCVFIRKALYLVLKYENDENVFVVNGPLPMTTDLLDELKTLDGKKTLSVPGADITLASGTPVMLHGLKKAVHLNGEFGDVRKYCDLSHRLEVHLEDKALKPVKVKHENLCIVFDLTDPKNLG